MFAFYALNFIGENNFPDTRDKKIKTNVEIIKKMAILAKILYATRSGFIKLFSLSTESVLAVLGSDPSSTFNPIWSVLKRNIKVARSML